MYKFHQLFCTSGPGFVVDVIFHKMERIGQIKDYAYESFNSPSAGTGGEVCRLKLHLVIIVIIIVIIIINAVVVIIM